MEVTKYEAATVICEHLGDGDRPQPADLVYLSEQRQRKALDELFRRAVRNAHPDLEVGTNEAFIAVREAWRVLADG